MTDENDVKWDDRPAFALDADVTVYWPDVRPCWEPVTSPVKENK